MIQDITEEKEDLYESLAYVQQSQERSKRQNGAGQCLKR